MLEKTSYGDEVWKCMQFIAQTFLSIWIPRYDKAWIPNVLPCSKLENYFLIWNLILASIATF